MEREPDFKAVAILTLNGADDLTTEQRHEIALWLRRQGEALKKGGNNYSNVFRARFLQKDTL
jgi:hypothetical protein